MPFEWLLIIHLVYNNTYMSTNTLSIEDPINQKLLVVAEDQMTGFHPRPFSEIARRSGLTTQVVTTRLKELLQGGVVRRIRQTLATGNLAAGALVAWKVPADKMEAAFQWLWENDPFTGHVVIRQAQPGAIGSDYQLWTTVKVPRQYSVENHCQLLGKHIHAQDVRLLPVIQMFALSVGHVRRQGLQPGAMTPQPAPPKQPVETNLTDQQWSLLAVLKRDLALDEIDDDLWARRAKQVNLSEEEFCKQIQLLADQGVIGRFSVFLEHSAPAQDGGRVTGANGLLQWRVPDGMEITAGEQIGRFEILTHVYWRQGAQPLGNANIYAVAHSSDREGVLAHKQAIDNHLKKMNIPVTYTSVFWGLRSRIRPSELLPQEYDRWYQSMH